MAKKKTNKRSSLFEQVLDDRAPQFKPKINRDHVAQEYRDKQDMATANELVLPLTSYAQRCVLS